MDLRTAASRYLFPVVLAASVGALAVAYVAQYAFGLEPCVLCSYQRIPYWAAAAIAGTALAVSTIDRAGTAALLSFVFACGAALAVYHAGVEQHWWASAAACAANGNLPMTFEAFRAAPLAPLAKPCDAIDWTLFGLSMTVYNAAGSAALAAVALAGALLLRSTDR